jgi:hypothetical protein
MVHVPFLSVVINGLGILGGITSGYYFQRMLRREEMKRNKMPQNTDKLNFEQFQENLQKERIQAAGKFLTCLNNRSIPPH